MLRLFVEKGDITSTFASSLLRQADHLSPKQLAWVHKLVVDKVGIQTPPSSAMYPKIANMFEYAGSKLAKPTITITRGDDQTIVIRKLPCDHHMFPHQLYVYVDGEYNGRINKEGCYVKSATSLVDITEVLADLNANPQQYARQYGQRTGCCCLCNKRMTTERSLQAGYGPVCAVNYNMEY